MKRKHSEKLVPVGDQRTVFYGLPALMMHKSTSIQKRAELILGMKPNQMIRSVKDCSSSIYRHAVQISGVSSVPALPKEDANSDVIAEIFGSSSLRADLLEEHAKASFGKGKNPNKIPIIEYALIKDWKPEFEGLQRGQYGGYAPSMEPKKQIIESELPTGEYAHRLFMTNDSEDNRLYPLISSPFDAFVFRPDPSIPWRSVAGFAPTWIVPVATHLLTDLIMFDEYPEEKQAKLAGAAFAIASIFGARLPLLQFLELQPKLAIYLEGVSGLTSDGQPWDGSVWPRWRTLPEQSRLSLCVSFLHQIGHRLVHQMSSEDLVKMRYVLDECETVLHQAATGAIETLRTELETLLTQLADMTESFAVTGLRVDFSTVVTLLDVWKVLLSDPQMLDKGPQQSRLLDQVAADIEVIANATDSLQRRFKQFQERHEEISNSNLPWLEHAERMSKLTGELSGFAKECEELDERFADQPLPTLVADEPQAEESESDEAAELRQQVELHVERSQMLEEQNVDLASRLSGIDAENDALRQENTELRLRSKHLQEALSANSKTAPSDIQYPALLDAVDLIVENQDAASVLRFLETAYPDRLRVFDSVYDQLHRLPSLPVSTLYQRTKALATVGVDVMRDSGRTIDLRDVVPGDIAVQESETVKKSAKLRAMRKFRDGQKSREIFTHINIDYSHRLYFEYDADEGRMLIAYAGKHLPSAKSATV